MPSECELGEEDEVLGGPWDWLEAGPYAEGKDLARLRFKRI